MSKYQYLTGEQKMRIYDRWAITGDSFDKMIEWFRYHEEPITGLYPTAIRNAIAYANYQILKFKKHRKQYEATIAFEIIHDYSDSE